MIQRDYLIIGSGIGGGSACESIRKHDKRGSVILAIPAGLLGDLAGVIASVIVCRAVFY